jgi:ATP-dependent Clp protease ATP-binding subunit ClpA
VTVKPVPFRYLSEEEQVALATEALSRALASFKSWQATLKARRILDSVVPVNAQAPYDRDRFVRALERLLGQVIIDELGRPWLVQRIRKNSHNCSAVTLRRLVDGVRGVREITAVMHRKNGGKLGVGT